ncbi:MAG TPA: ABC transporter substrate-binding protein [Dictyoglomaceae bacterium]|nr:ABC transporter substrate-binding protein [Dictyoglomaceae bacterium]
MKRYLFLVVLLVSISVLLSGQVMSQVLPAGLPRNETFIVDQIYRYSTAQNFNIWVPGAGEQPVRQGLVSDSLWYVDQQTGKWINSLAKEPPKYNKDFTEMTVKFRNNIYWSDGVKFTADDFVFTVQTLIETPGMQWNSELSTYVKEVDKIDDFTALIKLKEPNPRFHYYFTVRWNGVYMMPKHVWEKVKDPLKFTFWPPVSLGAYVIKDADPQGYWEIFERRDDWKRTTAGIITGKPGPKYILQIYYGPDEKKVAAMTQHNLDLLMDLDIEAFQALLKRDPYARSWYKDFPWVWPDELDSRIFCLNNEKFPFTLKDVRWALVLALDIVKLNTQYVNGVSKVNPIPEPPVPFLAKYYHKPLKSWLKSFKLEVDKGVYFKPFDDTIPQKIAEWAKSQGYTVSGTPEDVFGIGWWKYAPDIAEKLLLKNGFKRDKNGKWLLPDGKPWKISIVAAPDEVDAFRLAIGASDQWKKFGIDVTVEALERDPYYTKVQIGDYDISSSWSDGCSACAANAMIDKWQYIQGLHSNYYVPSGQRALTGNCLRIKDKKLDQIIDEMGSLSPNDPKALTLGREFMKLWVENMYGIVTHGFKKFVTVDTYYWTNYPSFENPYSQPNYWFMGGRFTYHYVEPTGRK